MGSLGYYKLIFSFDLLNLSYMESTTFYRIQIDQPNVFLFISENGSYKSGSKRVTVQVRTAVKILLAKLNHYGIRGIPLQLIESYLTDREQCVQVNNATSDFEKVSHGVPQGSILGPLFFLLYINDIANSSPILSF